jgi:hypothetical protein
MAKQKSEYNVRRQIPLVHDPLMVELITNPAEGRRPTPFNEDIANQILELTATTAKSIGTILEGIQPVSISYIVFIRWLNDYPQFRLDFARAREQKGDTLVEEILTLIGSNSVDMVEVADKKLKIDTLKWVASKLFPRKYADNIELPAHTEDKQKQVFRIGGKELEF